MKTANRLSTRSHSIHLFECLRLDVSRLSDITVLWSEYHFFELSADVLLCSIIVVHDKRYYDAQRFELDRMVSVVMSVRIIEFTECNRHHTIHMYLSNCIDRLPYAHRYRLHETTAAMIILT